MISVAVTVYDEEDTERPLKSYEFRRTVSRDYEESMQEIAARSLQFLDKLEGRNDVVKPRKLQEPYSRTKLSSEERKQDKERRIIREGTGEVIREEESSGS